MEAIEVRTYAGRDGPVVVLHGGPGAPGSAAALAAPLAPEFEVWEPRQRRSGDAPLTVERHVTDLHDVAASATTVVGHSWGAMLALSYAARYPADVRTLALVGCGTYDVASRAEYERRINANLGTEGLERKRALRTAIERAPDAAERDRLFAELGTLNLEAQSFELLPDVGPDPLVVDARGHAETWGDVLRRQAEGIEPQSFDSIAARVLMLHGDEDPHPGPMIRDSLRPCIPQIDYVEIARCGHEPWRERHGREPFLAALRAWLRDA
ncbi:MAG TPA: alpha/beta hydrolase [Acidimicrobiia bacterium]|nr:alpha/beta hydrolase [Acidimicrobiia bacterium]